MNAKLFKYFLTANEGKYLAKQEFNILKKKILLQEGKPDGYDTAITTDGKKWYLLRYWLNDNLFHIPQYLKPDNLKFHKSYSKWIHAENRRTDLFEVYKAFLILILYYDPERIDKLNHYQKMMEVLSNYLNILNKIVNEIREENRCAA